MTACECEPDDPCPPCVDRYETARAARLYAIGADVQPGGFEDEDE